MEIEFKERSTVKANIYGQTVSLRKPDVGQIEAMQAEMSAEGAKPVLVMKKFAEQLGLPIDVANKMELDHFQSLVEHLCGTKKK